MNALDNIFDEEQSFYSSSDLTIEICVCKKLATLAKLASIHQEFLEERKDQRKFIHEFFDVLFLQLFTFLQTNFNKLTKISYDSYIEPYEKIYSAKVKDLKRNFSQFKQEKISQIETNNLNFETELEQIIQLLNKQNTKTAQSLNSFVGSIKNIQNSILEASSTLSRIYKERMEEIDKENEEKAKQLMHDHETRLEEISSKFKDKLVDAMDNKTDLEAPFKRRPLSELKAETTIYKEEKANIVKKYYDIITSYNSYKRFPKRVLNELLSMLNLSKDENIKTIIDQIKEDLFSISSLYILKLHQNQIFQETEFDIFQDLLHLRHELYQKLCLLYKRKEDIDDIPRFTKMQTDKLIKETEKEKEQLDKEYNEYSENQKEIIEKTEEEMNNEIEALKRRLAREHRDAVQSVVIGDDFTIEMLQKEYERLSKENEMLDTKVYNENDFKYDDIEIEGFELIRSILLTRKLNNEVIKLKNSIPNQSDDLQKILLEAKIEQQNQMNIKQYKAYEEFLQGKTKENDEWSQKMKNHFEDFQKITNKTYKKINENFEIEKNKLLKLHKINKIHLFKNDKRVKESLQKLNYTKSKANISSEQYINFLEAQLASQLPPINSQRPKKPENQLQQILSSLNPK